MKKSPEENQLTAGQGLPAPVCSPFDIARQVESYAEEKIKETLRSGRLSVWPTVQDGIPGFTISMGMDIYRFVHVESVFEDAEDVSDPGWEKFCEMLESVAALWRECIEENDERMEGFKPFHDASC
jgi:hypothetical protein